MGDPESSRWPTGDCEDVRLIEESFKGARLASGFHVVTRGTGALDFLHQCNDQEGVPQPDVNLLALNIRDLSGRTALEKVTVEVLQA